MVDLVAERDDEILGWARSGPYREGEQLDAQTGELCALYVHPAHLGTGIGHALLTETTAHCTTGGHHRMRLWGLKANTPARRFYERAGFRADGTEESFEVDGVPIPEVRYERVLGAP